MKPDSNAIPSRQKLLIVLIGCSILFSLMTVFFQEQALGLQYLDEGTQLHRHLAVMQGTAPKFWQYRILCDYLLEDVIRIVRLFGVTHPVAMAFLLFRLLENFLIFLLAGSYYQRLGLNFYLSLLGMSAIAWGMTHALFNSDLQFSNYADVVFYLTAALLLLRGKDLWILVLAPLAALNRETAGCIPLMLLAARTTWRPRLSISRRAALQGGIALLLFAITLGGIILYFGIERRTSGYAGFKLFRDMVTSYRAWIQLFATLGILPLMAVAAMKYWPRHLKAFFWAVVPAWFAIIPFTGGMIETRHYLVPQVLIFIPGALFGALAFSRTPIGPQEG